MTGYQVNGPRKQMSGNMLIMNINLSILPDCAFQHALQKTHRPIDAEYLIEIYMCEVDLKILFPSNKIVVGMAVFVVNARQPPTKQIKQNKTKTGQLECLPNIKDSFFISGILQETNMHYATLNYTRSNFDTKMSWVQ